VPSISEVHSRLSVDPILRSTLQAANRPDRLPTPCGSRGRATNWPILWHSRDHDIECLVFRIFVLQLILGRHGGSRAGDECLLDVHARSPSRCQDVDLNRRLEVTAMPPNGISVRPPRVGEAGQSVCQRPIDGRNEVGRPGQCGSPRLVMQHHAFLAYTNR